MIAPQKVIDLARSNIMSYACLMTPNYQMPRHLVQIAKILHQVERGELKRVILTIPPRHGKSWLCSNHFPAWYLGRNPDKYIITATYGQELSDDFGRAVRNQLKDPLFKSVFPGCELAGDSSAANRFSTRQGGTYFAVGAGGAITGRGAHLLLIDDPIKNREDANSETKRRKLKEWYNSVAYTRLMPNGAVFVISTRWHIDDLVGFLLKEHAHEGWRVINLKALSDDNEPLWPESYSYDALQRIKTTIGPYEWNCLYQQEPMARDTLVLDFTKITGYDKLPQIKMVFTACDPAISKDKKACNTAFCTLGVGIDNHIYDLETIAGQWGFFETLDQAKNILNRQRSHYLGVESNQYQAALAEACSRYFQNVQVVSINAHRDKFLRAESISHIIDQGLFHTNNRELLDEIKNFDPEVTGEGRKDRVDALVHALHMVQKYAPASFEIKVNPFANKTKPQLHADMIQNIISHEIQQAFAPYTTDKTFYGEASPHVDPNYY